LISPSPIVIGEGEIKQVVFLTGAGLVSVFPRDGSVFWQHPYQDALNESSTTPVVVDDLLFASSITLGGVALKLENNRAIPGISKAWTAGALSCYFGTPVSVGKDTLYMVTGSLLSKKATLRCVDAKTAKEQWKRDNVGSYHASLLRTGDNKLLLVEEKGDLVLIEPNRKEYTELSRTRICGSTWVHPALANGRLYIRDEKELVCVEMPK
jgi:outer membrane protein assembly factor BamB